MKDAFFYFFSLSKFLNQISTRITGRNAFKISLRAYIMFLRILISVENGPRHVAAWIPTALWKWKASDFTYLCSNHLRRTDFYPQGVRRRLRPTAVPSEFVFQTTPPTTSRQKRYEESYLELSAQMVPQSSQDTNSLKVRLEDCRKNLYNAHRREKHLRSTLEAVFT